MGNISQFSNVSNAAITLSNLILVTPQVHIGYQPQNKPVKNGDPGQNPPTLVFHYEGEQTVTLESDITDHFVEDNTTIQDQIALRPELITAHGFIGELNDVAPELLAPLNAVANKLTVISGYVPNLSVTALLAYNQAFQAYQLASNIIDNAVSTWNSISETNTQAIIGSTLGDSTLLPASQNKQQIMFQQFYGYWRNRSLFTVQTPWAIFDNMAIKTLRAIQDAETRVITDFELTFKKIRFAQTVLLSKADVADFQTRAANQASPEVNLGTSSPIASTKVLNTEIAAID